LGKFPATALFNGIALTVNEKLLLKTTANIASLEYDIYKQFMLRYRKIVKGNVQK